MDGPASELREAYLLHARMPVKQLEHVANRVMGTQLRFINIAYTPRLHYSNLRKLR